MILATCAIVRGGLHVGHHACVCVCVCVCVRVCVCPTQAVHEIKDDFDVTADQYLQKLKDQGVQNIK